jgi:hypothetical protein
MNATAEMQWRSPSGDQPILAITGSFILLSNFRIVANLFAGKLSGFVRRRSKKGKNDKKLQHW